MNCAPKLGRFKWVAVMRLAGGPGPVFCRGQALELYLASLCVPVRDKWDHNETNQQVASYLQGARDKSANKLQIVAAYANNYDPASWAADPKDPSKQIHPQATPSPSRLTPARAAPSRL